MIIELDELFVEYKQDAVTQEVTAYVTTLEEVKDIPEGWALDETLSDENKFVYYKNYSENVEYELVEFLTESKHYAATIIIDSIDKTAPVANASITYLKDENDDKTSVIITVIADEEIQAVEGWALSEDKTTLTKIINRGVAEPTEEQQGSVTIKDLKGNETVVEYSYNWN